jgi:hypothetical protein
MITEINFTLKSFDSAPFNNSLNNVRHTYELNNKNAKEELLSIFGETTDLTEEERIAYNKMLKNGAIKTGIRMF